MFRPHCVLWEDEFLSELGRNLWVDICAGVLVLSRFLEFGMVVMKLQRSTSGVVARRMVNVVH